MGAAFIVSGPANCNCELELSFLILKKNIRTGIQRSRFLSGKFLSGGGGGVLQNSYADCSATGSVELPANNGQGHPRPLPGLPSCTLKWLIWKPARLPICTLEARRAPQLHAEWSIWKPAGLPRCTVKWSIWKPDGLPSCAMKWWIRQPDGLRNCTPKWSWAR